MKVLRRRALIAAAILVSALAGAASKAAPAEVDLPDGLPEGWYAVIETDAGRMVVRLLVDQAPQSVAHVAALAEGRLSWTDAFTGETVKRPYYDGLAIHLVAAGERFEAGDPTGTGRGAPPVWVPPEIGGGIDFSRPYRVGLTRASGGRISGASFFVTNIATTWFNRRHPCIGEVVEGQRVIERICAAKTDASGRPLEPVVIRRFVVRSVGTPAPIPEPVPYVPTIPKIEPRKPSDPQVR